MKKKDILIFEYAKLAALELIQGQKTINTRMKTIEEELQMTQAAIMAKATQMAITTLK